MSPVATHARPGGQAFTRPVKAAVTTQIAAGAGLATTAVILSITHRQSDQVPVFAAVALVLAADAVLVWREIRWAALINLIALAGQAAAVAGTIIELATGIAAVKAGQLRQLGVAPNVGVTINLIYSAVGFAIFCWYATRWIKTPRAPRT
jgi:hypothetical protein